MNKALLIILVLGTFLSACDSQKVYEKNINIKDNRWEYSNVLHFETNITDTLPKNVLLNFRHTFYFGKRNMLFVFKIKNPKGEESTYHINMPLSEPNGNWFGECAGDICDRTFGVAALQNYSFADTGVYQFSLAQNMRINPLPNAMSAGIRIENTTK